jgi:hypothetical protein
MSDPRDTVTLITVGYRSWDYLRFLAFTGSRVAESGWKEWLLIDNTLEEAEAEMLARLPGARVLPKGSAADCLRRSRHSPGGHSQDYACSVNALYQQVTTEYTLLVDPDIALLRGSWDRVLVDEIERNGYDAIGGPYNPYKWQKYAGYPSVIFLFIRTKLLQDTGFDFRSYFGNPIADRFQYFLHRYQRILNRYVPEVVRGRSRDTGWQLPRLFRSRRAATLSFGVPFIRDVDEHFPGRLQRVKPKHFFQRPGSGLFQAEDLVAGVYDEFWHQDALFATHHGGSGGAGGWASEKSRIWSSKVLDYLNVERSEFDDYLPGAPAPGETGSMAR